MQSAILSLYRTMARHRLYAVLNVGGLALGIAAFLVLFLFVRFETQYGRWLPGHDKLWLVRSEVRSPGFDTFENDTTSPALLSLLRSDYPDVRGTRFVTATASVRKGEGAVAEDLIQADTNFFRILPYPALVGDPAAALTRPGSAVITERIAQTYFGSAATAMGRTLTLTVGGKAASYTVAAVLRDLPADTVYDAGIFVPIAPLKPNAGSGWAFGTDTVLLRFPTTVAARALEAQLPAFLRRHPYDEPMPGMRIAMTLEPLDAFHLREGSAKTVAATLGAIGIVTLLIALVNYVNLATARAGLRAREVAIRKVLGATRRMLVVQFLAESIAVAALAGLFGLALAEVALPLVNAAGGTSLAIDYKGSQSILLPLVLVVLAAGIIAGFYPALILSAFRPAGVLASARAPGGGRAGARIRQALVVFQFAIAIALATGTAVLVAQTHHVRWADLGFDQKGLVLIPALGDRSLDSGRRARILAGIARLPGVTAVSHASFTPAGGTFMLRSMKPRGGGAEIPMNFMMVGDGFFDVMGARLVAGRGFDPRFAADDGDRSRDPTKISFGNVVLNEAAVHKLGLGAPRDAIGKPLSTDEKQPTVLIGVVADLRFNGPKNGDDALMYVWRRTPLDNTNGFVRFTGSSAAMIERIERVWRTLAPDVPFDAKTVEQARYDGFVRADEQRMRLFTIGAVLAAAIACIGLYGLASFDTARRFREIGIRKTLGASTADVLRLLIGQFLRPVLVAALLAWPVAFVVMRQWLSAFADRIDLSPAFFILSGMAALLVATATVAAHAWRVARAEPARALRYE